MPNSVRPPWNNAVFWASIEGLGRGEPAAVERALVFLEDDPWSPGSGHVKENLARKLARQTFDAEQQARLARVLVHSVDIGDRWDFRSYCRLSRAVPAGLLRDDLVRRLRRDPGVRRRALWMLAALRRPRLSEAQLTDVRSALLLLASEPPPNRSSTSLRGLAVRFWSLEWELELLDVVGTDDLEATAALRLLSRLPRLHHPLEDATTHRIHELRATDGGRAPGALPQVRS